MKTILTIICSVLITLVLTGLASESVAQESSNNTTLSVKIQPLHLEKAGTVNFEARHGNRGKFYLDIMQKRPFESIDHQRQLQTDCCLNMYRKNFSFDSFELNDGIKKSFDLSIEADENNEAGTFNTIIDFFVYPSY